MGKDDKGFEITCLNCGSHSALIMPDNMGGAYLECTECRNSIEYGIGLKEPVWNEEKHIWE